MKLRKVKKRKTSRRRTVSENIARRLADFEEQVRRGERDARSLIAIPQHLAVEASLSYPAPRLFGVPEDW